MLYSVAPANDWTKGFRLDLGRLADDRLPARTRRPAPASVDAVFLSWRYPNFPALGTLAWDVEQFDLAMRRAAYAVHQRIPIDALLEMDVRLSRDSGLRLHGSAPGSLDLLLGIPGWIVAALASQPTTALVNLITLLGTKEIIRVQLRRWVLSNEEEALISKDPEVLAPRPDLGHQTPELSAAVPAQGPEPGVPQGALPSDLDESLRTREPIVDVEIGRVRIRSSRPDIDIVIKEGPDATAISIREPRR